MFTPCTGGISFRITFYIFLGELEAADLSLVGCWEWCARKHSSQEKMVGGNPYTEELLQLEQCAPMVARPVAPQLAVIKTPLRVRALQQPLVQHPDGEFVKFVLRGIAGGLRIGFNYQRFSCKPARSNMKSAAENADVVEEYLFTEQSAGRVIGPLAPETVSFV